MEKSDLFTPSQCWEPNYIAEKVQSTKSDTNHPRKYWPSWSRLHFKESLESVLRTWRIVSSDDFGVTWIDSLFIVSKKDAIEFLKKWPKCRGASKLETLV